VVEEELVTRAQVVETAFAVGRVLEPVLGAAAMAGEAEVTLAAVARKRVSLVEAELPLLLGGDEIDQRALGDVPEQTVGLAKR
jgi:hypothetical protein